MNDDEQRAWKETVKEAGERMWIDRQMCRASFIQDRAVLAADAELARFREKLDREKLAELFHVTYESLAPQFGYRTRDETACPWVNVPDDNRRLMLATCDALIAYLTE